MTSKQRNFIRQLSAQAKRVIKARQANVFKYGKVFSMIAALPVIGLDSLQEACKQDPFFCLENTPWIFDGFIDMYNQSSQSGTCQ